MPPCRKLAPNRSRRILAVSGDVEPGEMISAEGARSCSGLSAAGLNEPSGEAGTAGRGGEWSVLWICVHASCEIWDPTSN